MVTDTFQPTMKDQPHSDISGVKQEREEGEARQGEEGTCLLSHRKEATSLRRIKPS